MPLPPQYGLFNDRYGNSRIDLNYAGTWRLRYNATGASVNGTINVSGASTLTGNVTMSGTATVTGLVTASAALTVATGDFTNTAGDQRITAGNIRLGPVNAFGTTEPTQALVMEAGTAPAGSITTSGGVFSSTTVVRKIIADGTVSNVET